MDHNEKAMAYLKDELDAPARAAFEAELTRSEAARQEVETARAILDALESASSETSAALCKTMLQEAIRQRAGFLHIQPGAAFCEDAQKDATENPDACVVSIRVDGQLYEIMRYPREQHPGVIARWKQMADMDMAETRPQDGRVVVRFEGKNVELFYNIMATVNGERVTARLFDAELPQRGLDALSLSPAQRKTLARMTESPYGFLMVAGQAGAGKTTLLYALMQHLLAPGQPTRNIMTIEDAPEYRIPGISQTMVNRNAGMSFAVALRCFLRCNPDVVYCAQMRDLETAEVATEMALSRCLVLSQLHVSSAAFLPQRFREMGVVSFLIAQTLVGAVGVRVVRRVCPHCATEYQPDVDELRRAGLSQREDGPYRKGAGCEQCRQTGFLGRIGLYEILEPDASIRQLIAEGASGDTIWQASFGRLGGSLLDDARAKVRQGLTTVEETNRALFDYPRTGFSGSLPSPLLLTDFGQN